MCGNLRPGNEGLAACNDSCHLRAPKTEGNGFPFPFPPGARSRAAAPLPRGTAPASAGHRQPAGISTADFSSWSPRSNVESLLCLKKKNPNRHFRFASESLYLFVIKKPYDFFLYLKYFRIEQTTATRNPCPVLWQRQVQGGRESAGILGRCV